MNPSKAPNPASTGSSRQQTSSPSSGVGNSVEQKRDRARIVLIDDDPIYGAVIRRWAELEKVDLDVFNSLDDLGFVGLLSKYDVAIVDYDLGELNGKDVADYMSTLFGNKPMVMISVVDRSTEIMNCPSCVKAFMKKSAGYEKILNTALKLRKNRDKGLQ